MSKAPALGRSTASGNVDPARDRRLVARCQAGDQAAFAELYAAYHDRLVRSCLRRLGDAHEAEDAAQEAFVKAWRALDRFDGPQHFYAWLSVIASHVCLDVVRRRQRVELVAEVEQRADAGEFDEMAEHLVTAEDAATATRALSLLSRRHRRVLQLREEFGWSTHDIAAAEGLAPNAVDSLLWRARLALQRQFRAVSEGVAGVVGLGAVPALALRRRVDELAHRVTGRSAAMLPGLRAPAVWTSSLVIAGGVLVATTTTTTPRTAAVPVLSGAAARPAGVAPVATPVGGTGHHAEGAGATSTRTPAATSPTPSAARTAAGPGASGVTSGTSAPVVGAASRPTADTPSADTPSAHTPPPPTGEGAATGSVGASGLPHAGGVSSVTGTVGGVAAGAGAAVQGLVGTVGAVTGAVTATIPPVPGLPPITNPLRSPSTSPGTTPSGPATSTTTTTTSPLAGLLGNPGGLLGH